MDNILDHFSVQLPTLQIIIEWLLIAFRERALLYSWIHMIISALFPIYIGAHASLRCPPSANHSKNRGKKGGLKDDKDDDDDDDDDEIDTFLPDMPGLQPSDAILFPFMAGLVLSGLYFLIKWLDDPKLLNRALNLYLSFVGVIGVGRLATDALNVVTTFIFPSVWSTKKEIFFVDSSSELKSRLSNLSRAQSNLKLIDCNHNPLPGPLSSISFSAGVLSNIWFSRSLLMKRWILRGYIQNTYHAAHRVRVSDFLGFIFGLLTIILYNLTEHSWWHTNLIAFGFCYGTLQLMSPTTFWTGSLVLFGLFMYDIIMVFYTPLMVTVASSLDVPIKLIIPGPGRGSMLGLGDIVLPGIMVALALRFDLYLHYLRKQKRYSPDTNGNVEVLKSEYSEVTGAWGERFWCSFLDSKPKIETTVHAGNFPKVYFWISMTGYVIGLIVTLIILNITKHAQPALLYFVPGVLAMLWGTAWIRGDLQIMWEYTEDGVWGTDIPVDNKVNSRGQGGRDEKGIFVFGTNSYAKDVQVSNLTNPGNKVRGKDKLDQHVFLFSLTACRTGLKK